MTAKDYSQAFKALADPTRREIIRHLRKRDQTPSDLSLRFNISKPSLSHHLALLRSANLVTSQKSGQKIFYALNQSQLQEMWSDFRDQFK